MKEEEEELEKLHREVSELCQDILDSIMSSEKFDEMYYIREKTEKMTRYELREKYVDDSIHYIYRIETHTGGEIFSFTITTATGDMKFKVNAEFNTVDQTVREFFSGDIVTFEGGLRMDDDDIELLTDILDWCEKYNPSYW